MSKLVLTLLVGASTCPPGPQGGCKRVSSAPSPADAGSAARSPLGRRPGAALQPSPRHTVQSAGVAAPGLVAAGEAHTSPVMVSRAHPTPGHPAYTARFAPQLQFPHRRVGWQRNIESSRTLCVHARLANSQGNAVRHPRVPGHTTQTLLSADHHSQRSPWGTAWSSPVQPSHARNGFNPAGRTLLLTTPGEALPRPGAPSAPRETGGSCAAVRACSSQAP